MEILRYTLIASVCLGFFYIAYRLLFRQCVNFQHARIFLVASMILSLIIPLSGYTIHTGWFQKKQAVQVVLTGTNPVNVIPAGKQSNHGLWLVFLKHNLKKIAIGVYLAIAGILLIRILAMLIILRLQYGKSYKVHLADCILLYNHRFQTTFSFFRWIFIHPVPDDSDLEQIITHEKVHVNQYHSFDILLIELLTAVMWFNPFAWMLKGSLQLVHEYQADDGALRTGIDKSKYQALLINQVTEERLVALSSSFNQSLIKKRIIMMTKSKIRKNTLSRLLAIVPVALLVFIVMAGFNGATSPDTKTSNDVVRPDTVIKKTIIKKVSKDHPNDTIVTEKEEVLTGKDAEDEVMKVRMGEDSHSWDVTVASPDHKHVAHSTSVTHSEDVSHSGNVSHSETISHSDDQGGTRRYTVHIDDDKSVREEDFGDSVKTVIVIKDDGDKVKHEERKVIIRHSGDEPASRILYLVDGKPVENLESLDPKQIESMTVLNKKETMEKYTKEDYDGVILINMKKGTK
ncbi:MAG TPA: M56 family metallopeptidase [Bacteroidales bacterium]|nr:M56 family metallopeptidase [Bacteroidales bacterium]